MSEIISNKKRGYVFDITRKNKFYSLEIRHIFLSHKKNKKVLGDRKGEGTKFARLFNECRIR